MPTVSELISGNISNAMTNMKTWGSLVFNAIDYKATGDGTTDDSGKINDAVTAASANGGTVVFPPGTYRVASNLTIPSNVTLWFMNGAKLSVDNGVTVTINGPIEAGLYQIFAGQGTVTGAIQVPAFYPQWWGAKGDGVSDDTTAIQNCVNAAMTTGGEIVFTGKGPYSITKTIEFKPQESQNPAGSGSDVHFSDTKKNIVRSPSRAIIRANAAIGDMFKFVFNNDITDGTGPFYSEVHGLQFDGNNLATTGITFDWVMHSKVEKCSFWKLQFGLKIGAVEAQGYGVAEVLYNVFKCSESCLVLNAGDNIVMHNDFFPSLNGVYVAPWGGNTSIKKNIFSRNGSTGTLYGVRLAGADSATGNEEIRDVYISGNEFSGIDYAVYATGHTTAKNVYNCYIINNHVNGYATYNTNMLAYLSYCMDITIAYNRVGGKNNPDQKMLANLINCDRIHIECNEIINCTDTPIFLTNCTDCNILRNNGLNVGKSASGNGCIGLYGSSSGNVFKHNRFKQENSSYAQNGIVEVDTGNNNLADWNMFENIGTEYYVTGANTVFKSRLYGSAPPSTGTWIKGAVMENTDPTAGGNAGWICVAGGTPGTWKSFGTIAT